MADASDGSRVPDKGGVLASAKDPVLRPGPISIYISRKTASCICARVSMRCSRRR